MTSFCFRVQIACKFCYYIDMLSVLYLFSETENRKDRLGMGQSS